MSLFPFQYAIKSLMRRKSKNSITILAIALGVALFIGAQSATNGVVQTHVNGNLDIIGETDITISNPASPNGFFPQNIMDRITGSSDPRIQNNILSMAPVIQFITSVYSEGLIEADVILNGIQPTDSSFGDFIDYETEEIIDINTKLRGIGTSDVLVSQTIADDLDLNVNDVITFSFSKGNGDFALLNLAVSAIYDDHNARGKDGFGLGEVSGQFYVNLELIQSEFLPEFQSSINQLKIIVKDIDRSINAFDANEKTFPGKSKIEETMVALEDIFRSEGIDTYGNAPLIFSSRVNLANTIVDRTAELTSVLPIIAFVINATALLLIVNIQIMSVDDRKNQTAVLRALGSNITTIFTIFIIEATIVGIFGALIGYGLGYIVSVWILSLLSDVFGVTLAGSVLNVDLVISAIIIGILISVITAVLPSLNAARSSVSNALRGIDEEKTPRKGYTTLILGISFTLIGLAFASNIGEFWEKEAWNTFGKQASILLGLGLTLAGLSLLLTIILPRKVALSISGIVLWGLGIFSVVVTIGWAESGDGASLFPIILFYNIAGSTILVAQNYDTLMNWLMKVMYTISGLTAIGQVTTQQMVGKKSRGILVFTILSIILFMTIMPASFAETQRESSTVSYEPMTFGVDVQITVTSATDGIEERILSIKDREASLETESLPTIERVYSFRRAFVPLLFETPVDPLNPTIVNQDFDVTQHLIYVPVIEIPQTMLNPDLSWGDNSLPFRFQVLSDIVKQEANTNPSIADNNNKHIDSSKAILDMFYDPVRNVREQEISINNQKSTVTQRMAIGSALMPIIFQDIALNGLDNFNFYFQDKNGIPLPMYIGATTTLDMLGVSDLMGYGILVSEDISSQLPQFEELTNPNLFLVKSSNSFNLKDNDVLANAIEKDLNDLNNPNSFSSKEGQLVGAASRIVYEEINEYFSEQAAFADFIAAFSTLGLVMGGLGMIIIAVRSVSERTREIGMMRAIGFSRSSIVIGVLIEMFTLSLLGLILGIINAIVITEGLGSTFLGITMIYPIDTILSYITGIIGLSLVSGMIPGYIASKVAPSQALRYTG